MTNFDKGVGDLPNEVLELRRRGGAFVRGDLVLALRAGLVNSACPADHAEEPVERSVLKGATPPLFTPAAGALDPVSNYPGALMATRTNHHVTGRDETPSSGEKATEPDPRSHQGDSFSSR